MQVDLKNAHAGMTLGADVVSARGQLLLKAGSTLSGKHLQLLLANGIEQVEIGAAAAAVTAPPPDAAALEEQLDERFRISDDQHPVIRELRRLCRQRLGGTSVKGEGND